MDLLKQLNKLDREYRFKNEELKQHLHDNLSNYINFINPCDAKEGVYFIENFYIGKSGNLKNRMVYHLLDLMRSTTVAGAKLNYEKITKMRKIISHRPITVVVLDDNPETENLYIDGYYLCNPLTNKLAVTGSRKLLKAKNILQYREYSKITTEKIKNTIWLSTIQVQYPINMELTFRGKTENESVLNLKNFIGLYVN